MRIRLRLLKEGMQELKGEANDHLSTKKRQRCRIESSKPESKGRGKKNTRCLTALYFFQPKRKRKEKNAAVLTREHLKELIIRIAKRCRREERLHEARTGSITRTLAPPIRGHIKLEMSQPGRRHEMISYIQLEFPLPRVLIRRAYLQWLIGIGRGQSAHKWGGKVSNAILRFLNQVRHGLAPRHMHLACLHELLDGVTEKFVLGDEGRGIPAKMLAQFILILEGTMALRVHAVIGPALLYPMHLLVLLQRGLMVETLGGE